MIDPGTRPAPAKMRRGKGSKASPAEPARKTATKRPRPKKSAAPPPAAETPLRIPFGNKAAAQQLGARYRAGGWYAPPGTALEPFRERGWL